MRGGGVSGSACGQAGRPTALVQLVLGRATSFQHYTPVLRAKSSMRRLPALAALRLLTTAAAWASFGPLPKLLPLLRVLLLLPWPPAKAGIASLLALPSACACWCNRCSCVEPGTAARSRLGTAVGAVGLAAPLVGGCANASKLTSSSAAKPQPRRVFT